MQEYHTDVLVIGAGPTGLFVSAELARHGVQPRVIDKCPAPHTQTRATGIQPASLELFHRAGIVKPFLKEAVPVKGLRILDHTYSEAFVMSGQLENTIYPDTLSMPQWRTEEILNEHLKSFGVNVERGVTAQEIEIHDAGAFVECEDAGGQRFKIHADYLVGAGGAHSPVRGALNENLEGITYPRRYLVGNVASKGAHRDDHFLSVAISSAGMLMAAELPHGRTLLVMDLPEGEISGEAPTLADFRQTMAAHLSKPFEIDDLRWSAMYRTHRRMAPKFSKGRCFLAGDAAHLCSPLGGEGMNSGFLDGASLAWMLAAVIRGDAKACLLDAYEPERQEIARQVLASSEAKHDFYYTLVAQAAEGKPLQPPAEDPTRKVTSPDMLDLATFESPILGFHGATQGIKAVRPGSRFSHRTQLNGCLHTLLVFGSSHGVDPTFFQRRWSNVLTFQPGDPICSAERAGVSTQGAVLIRPDGHVGYQMDCWSPESALALEEYLKAHFHPQGQG